MWNLDPSVSFIKDNFLQPYLRNYKLVIILDFKLITKLCNSVMKWRKLIMSVACGFLTNH